MHRIGFQRGQMTTEIPILLAGNPATSPFINLNFSRGRTCENYGNRLLYEPTSSVRNEMRVHMEISVRSIGFVCAASRGYEHIFSWLVPLRAQPSHK